MNSERGNATIWTIVGLIILVALITGLTKIASPTTKSTTSPTPAITLEASSTSVETAPNTTIQLVPTVETVPATTPAPEKK